MGTEEVKNRWIRNSDSFMAFCMDYLESDFERRISKKELRQVYKNYCKKHKTRGVSDNSIKATLQEMFGVSEEFVTLEMSQKQENVWTGIKFKMGVQR